MQSRLSAPRDCRIGPEVYAALSDLFGERLSTGPEDLARHGQGASYHPALPPDAVVWPQSTDEVSACVRLCRKYSVPMIAFGAGTSLEAHVHAPEGGLCIDLSRMDRILAIHPDDLDARVEAGVMRSALNAALTDSGLFFPIGPGADASIGGMAATCASGTNAVRYGTMKENVLGLTVVLSDGRVIRTGGRCRKSASGYDLTHVFVGSEGTLGIITEISLRLYGRPRAVAAAVCPFQTLAGAVKAVIRTIQNGIAVARIELLDAVQMDAVNRYANTAYPGQPTLFLEFQADSDAVLATQTQAVAAIAGEQGGGEFQWASSARERQRLWQARHDVAHACKALRPGGAFWSTDVCVPISRLADCILETREDIEASGLTAPIVGHVGDGNFHVIMVFDPDDAGELQRCEALNRRLIERALSMQGTCSGEHGIGMGKRAYMRREHGEALEIMRELKQLFDPLGLMNPGKVLPDG